MIKSVKVQKFKHYYKVKIAALKKLNISNK